MNESKIELTNRLQREGRWSEASAFKDEHIAKLRAEGMTRKEAQQAAWEAMEGKFPPLEDIEQTSAEELAVDVSQFASNDSPEFFEDAQWVYQHLLVSSLNPEDAPSSGAWGLLRWAKRNQNRFFEHVMQKVATTKEKAPPANPDELPEKYMTDLTEIRQMISGCESGIDERAIANTPKWVREQVSEDLYHWTDRIDFEFPIEARDRLIQNVTEMVDRVIRLALDEPESFCRAEEVTN